MGHIPNLFSEHGPLARLHARGLGSRGVLLLALGSLAVTMAMAVPLGGVYLYVTTGAVALSALFGGGRGGVLATAVCVAGVALLDRHYPELGSQQSARSLVGFAVFGGVLAAVGGALRAAYRQLERERDRARQAAEERERVARRLEAVADENERRAAEMETVLDAIAHGLVLYDAAGAVVRMNAAAQRLLAFTDAERDMTPSERRRAYRLEAPDGRELAVEETPVGRALRGEQVRGVVVRVRRRDDPQPVWVAVSAAPVRAANGTLLGVASTYADITRLHELQQEREDMIRAISHDLRTPLSAVGMQAELLERHAGDPTDVARRARAVAEATRRIAGMIDELLEVGRLDADQVQVAPEPIDVRSFAAALAGALFPQAGARLELELPHGLVALADRDALERVLGNLIGNALKYSPPDAPVQVSARRAGPCVEIAVADRGRGIPPEDLPRLFHRYQRARNAGGREGLGLGLYIARKLVEAQRGRVEVESRLGEGSVFRVLLPPVATESQHPTRAPSAA